MVHYWYSDRDTRNGVSVLFDMQLNLCNFMPKLSSGHVDEYL